MGIGDKLNNPADKLEKCIKELGITERQQMTVEKELATLVEAITDMKKALNGVAGVLSCVAGRDNPEGTKKAVSAVVELLHAAVDISVESMESLVGADGIMGKAGWVGDIMRRTEDLIGEGMDRYAASTQAITELAPPDEREDLLERIRVTDAIVKCIERGPEGKDELMDLLQKSDPNLVKQILSAFPGAHHVGDAGIAIPVGPGDGIDMNSLMSNTLESNGPITEDDTLPWVR